jgi:hypothetical protein
MVYMMMKISMCNRFESVYLTKYLKMPIKVLHRLMHQTTDLFISVKPLYILMCTCYCKSQCCCCCILNKVFTYVFSLWQSVILPCACYLTILGKKATHFQVILCSTIIAIGVVCLIGGTYSSVAGIIDSLHNG